jgi:hypothetical protein
MFIDTHIPSFGPSAITTGVRFASTFEARA